MFKNGFLGVITDISVELIWKVCEDSSIHDNINRYTYINIYIYIYRESIYIYIYINIYIYIYLYK